MGNKSNTDKAGGRDNYLMASITAKDLLAIQESNKFWKDLADDRYVELINLEIDKKLLREALKRIADNCFDDHYSGIAQAALDITNNEEG